MTLASKKSFSRHAGKRGDAKKAAIIESAKSIFLQAGFGGTSMDGVAARAGVSKMTVYRHYGSKETLFAGVISDLCERIVDDDLGAILERPPRQALRHFAWKMIDIVFARDTIELHRIVVAESRRFPELGLQFYRTGPEACIGALESYFKSKMRDPQFKLRNPRRAAEEFLELLRGYAHLRVALGIDRKISKREAANRIEAAIRHVMHA